MTDSDKHSWGQNISGSGNQDPSSHYKFVCPCKYLSREKSLYMKKIRQLYQSTIKSKQDADHDSLPNRGYITSLNHANPSNTIIYHACMTLHI